MEVCLPTLIQEEMLSESLATEDLPPPSLGLQEDGLLERHDRITFINLKEFHRPTPACGSI